MKIVKKFVRKKPSTNDEPTEVGRSRIDLHCQQLERLRAPRRRRRPVVS